MDTLLRLDEVRELTKLSRSTIWRLERAGEFPRRVKLSKRAVGWRARDIEAWIDSRCDDGDDPDSNCGKPRSAA